MKHNLNEPLFVSLHLRSLGESHQAANLLLDALKIEPTRADLWHHLSLAYEAAGDANRAISASEKASALKPTAVFRYRLAKLLLNLGNLERAASVLDEILQSNPSFAPAHFSKSKIYLMKGDVQDEIKSLEHAILHSPRFVDAYLLLAEAFTHQTRHAEAETILFTLTCKCPRYLAGHVKFAECLKLQNKLIDEEAAWVRAAEHVACASAGSRRAQSADQLDITISKNIQRLRWEKKNGRG